MNRFVTGAVIWLVGLGLAERSEASCTISTNPVAFGNYNVFTVTPDDANGRVTYRCNASEDVTVTLSTGTSGTFTPRQMASGAERLNYNLYRDAARTILWGDGTGGTQFYSRNNVPNMNINVTIFGRIQAGEDAAAGSYSDTVVATINW
jgi:spore coat protein U-like protein